MELTSRKVKVAKSPEALCQFLSDVKNFEQLMPENTSKFEMIRDDAFVFALKGMPEIALEVKEVQPPNTVVLGAISDKLPFTLTGNISEADEENSEAANQAVNSLRDRIFFVVTETKFFVNYCKFEK